jgi:heme-degrading monooxygenase HmoA
MYAVIFEVTPTKQGKEAYLDIAAKLKGYLQNQKGLISIERFQSLVDENKLLSLSFWEDEDCIASWRNQFEHKMAQKKGNEELFEAYRIRVAYVQRDYTKTNREQAPKDSNEQHC